jgi:hypothetical protein
LQAVKILREADLAKRRQATLQRYDKNHDGYLDDDELRFSVQDLNRNAAAMEAATPHINSNISRVVLPTNAPENTSIPIPTSAPQASAPLSDSPQSRPAVEWFCLRAEFLELSLQQARKRAM